MANNPGINKLARVLAQRMGEHSASPQDFELGQITKNGSLVTDTFKVPVPKQDYVLNHLLLGEDNKLKSGDRVLVVWVHDTPVVICVIASGKEL